PINWSRSQTGRFTTQFTAPAAPWFAGSKVAPLRPGRYAVLFACLPAFEKPSGLCGGGALGSHFDLTGTGSGLCTGGKNCAVVQTSPAEGPPGTLVAVDGWAPLTGLNGTGFIDAAIEGQPRGKPGSQNPSSFTASLLSCASVALDSRYPGTLYAVFSAVPRNSGPPPFYFVAYVTRNSGRTWQPVPVPAKSEMGRFGGFRVSPAGVQALLWSQAT